MVDSYHLVFIFTTAHNPSEIAKDHIDLGAHAPLSKTAFDLFSQTDYGERYAPFEKF